jgi:hypothetical protein
MILPVDVVALNLTISEYIYFLPPDERLQRNQYFYETQQPQVHLMFRLAQPQILLSHAGRSRQIVILSHACRCRLSYYLMLIDAEY